MDYYSKFFDVSKVNGTDTEDTINALKQHFARHGIGEKLISDNGPGYSSQRLAEFAKTHQFEHTLNQSYKRTFSISFF